MLFLTSYDAQSLCRKTRERKNAACGLKAGSWICVSTSGGEILQGFLLKVGWDVLHLWTKDRAHAFISLDRITAVSTSFEAGSVGCTGCGKTV